MLTLIFLPVFYVLGLRIPVEAEPAKVKAPAPEPPRLGVDRFRATVRDAMQNRGIPC